MRALFPSPQQLEDAMWAVAEYRLAEKFGPAVFEWGFDRVRSMLLLMEVDAQVRKERDSRTKKHG